MCIRDRKKKDRKAKKVRKSAQQTIPYVEMYRDGICKVNSQMCIRDSYMPDGVCDYFLMWICVGLPFGIRRMCLWLVPSSYGISGLSLIHI